MIRIQDVRYHRDEEVEDWCRLAEIGICHNIHTHDTGPRCQL